MMRAISAPVTTVPTRSFVAAAPSAQDGFAPGRAEDSGLLRPAALAAATGSREERGAPSVPGGARELAVPGAGVAGLVARFAGAELQRLEARLREEGRPDPAADLRWLGERLAPGESATELLPFYVFGRRHYEGNPQGEPLLEASLHGLHEVLERTGGEFGGLPRPEKARLLSRLVQAIPPDNPQYVLHHSDCLSPLGHLSDVLKLDRPTRMTAGLGPTERREFVASPPPAGVPGYAAALDELLDHLDRIQHAEGRQSPRRAWSDEVSAGHAVQIETFMLHRDPERVAEFRDLLGFFQNPWNAFAVQLDLDGVADRAEARGLVLEAAREMRVARGEAPQDLIGTIPEGEQVGRYSRWVGMMARHKPSEATLTAWIPQAREAWNVLAPEFPWEGEKAFEAALAARRQDQAPSAAAADFVRFHRELRDSGVPAEAALSLQVHLRSADDRGQVVDVLRTARIPGPAMAGVVDAAVSRRRPEESLVESVRRVSDDYYLSGEIDGICTARARVAEAASRGELCGPLDDLLSRFETGVRLGRLAGREPKAAIEEALAALRPSGDAGSIRTDGGLVSIGGVLLPVRA